MALLDGWDRKGDMFRRSTQLEEREEDENVVINKDNKYEEYNIDDIPQKNIDSTVAFKDELSRDSASSRLQCTDFSFDTTVNKVDLNPLSNWLGTIVGSQKNEVPTNPTLNKDIPHKSKLSVLKQCSSDKSLINQHNDTDVLSSINRGRSEYSSSEEAVTFSSGTNNVDSKKVSLDFICNPTLAGRKEKAQKKRVKLEVKKNNNKKGVKNSCKIFDSFIQSKECNFLPILQSTPIPSSDGKITILRRNNKTTNTKSHDQSNITCRTGGSKVECNDFLNPTISNHLEQYKSIMMSELKDTVRIEIQETLLPTLLDTMSQQLDKSVVKLILPSIVKCIKELFNTQSYEIVDSVSKSVKDPVSVAFHQSMSEIIIPTYESATRQMFTQISLAMESTLCTNESIMDKNLLNNNEETVQKLDKMKKLIEELLDVTTKLQNPQNISFPSKPASSHVLSDINYKDIKEDIISLIHCHDYNAAFTKALSASDAGLAIFTCENSDIVTILEGPTPKLSQPILLCLMQQLGSHLLLSNETELNVEVAWLQHIAVTLDPLDERIKNHLFDVRYQLIENIHKKISETSHIMKRPLQMLLQVIRGIPNS